MEFFSKVFVYMIHHSKTMLTNKLKESLNKKWGNCWPVSDLRPLALLDLISYLFFIKKIDDFELIHQKVKTAGMDNFIYTKEIEDFSWSTLQSLTDREIHQLFIKEHGVIDLMNNYAQLNSLYSDYFKSPLLIEPTPKLISNAIQIINIIETNDNATREKIVEYLFAISKINSKNNQVFLPEHILKLMISFAEPVPGDIIFNPAVGNGSLLISAFKYINSSNNPLLQSSTSHPSNNKISGWETDVVHLRIAALNMNLHGMNDPNINIPSTSKTLKEKASLVISSLPSSIESASGSGNSYINQREKEAFLLNNITENLSSSGRAVVLVRQDLLQNEDVSIVKIRKKLVDQYNLEGIIMLDSKSDTLFPGAVILIFDNSKTITQNIWFYKWKKKIPGSSLSDDNKNYDFAEVENILEKWKIRNDSSTITSSNNFFIPADNIRSNNYNLCFYDYKLNGKQEASNLEADNNISETKETVLSTKRENLHQFFMPGAPIMPIKKRKRKVLPVLVIVLIIITAALAFFWAYSEDNNYHPTGRFDAPGSNVFISNNIKNAAG